MDEISIVKLCMDSFSGSEISDAKQLLFQSIDTSVKNVSRRKEVERRDLEDIICAFKNTEPDQTPIFVAKELHKLPPVTFDHVHVTRLLKDIILLQTEVKHIKQTYATSEELLEQKNIVNTSGPSDEHVNKRRGAYLFDSRPPGTLNFSNMSVVNSSPDHEQESNYLSLSRTRELNAQRVKDVSLTSTRGDVLDKSALASETQRMTVAGSMQNVNNSPVATMPAQFELNYSKSAAEVVRSEGEWKPEEPESRPRVGNGAEEKISK